MEAQPRSISPVNGPADRHELLALYLVQILLPKKTGNGKPVEQNRRATRLGFAPTPLILTVGMPQRVRKQPDILTFEGAASGRDKAFLIEYCGDLLVHFTGPV